MNARESASWLSVAYEAKGVGMSEGEHYTNYAKDSTVGAMISKVDGNVSFGTGARVSADSSALNTLSTRIDDLRTELRASRRRGEIDEDRAQAVEKELDEASQNLPSNDGAPGSRFILAMMRAKGLVEGLAGLTTKIADAIAAVQGTQ